METSIGTVVVAENPIFNPDLEVGGTESLKKKETMLMRLGQFISFLLMD